MFIVVIVLVVWEFSLMDVGHTKNRQTIPKSKSTKAFYLLEEASSVEQFYF
jgi:hypothetical protein